MAMKQKYGPMLLNRHPTVLELREIDIKYAASGSEGCIGCVDCMHLVWKNCNKEFKGQYNNHKAGKFATISCECWKSSTTCWMMGFKAGQILHV